MNFHLSVKSGNSKVGPIPVSTSTKETCPPSCAFFASCYAASGPLNIHWRAVTEGRRGGAWGDFLAAVKALPKGVLWRHNQAGDLPGKGDTLDTGALRDLVRANKGKRGFTYTHKPLNKASTAAIKAANKAGFTINLSANTLAHADELAKADVAPVVVVLAQAEGDATPTRTPDGRLVVVCPATYKADVTCASCQLCQRQTRQCIVGFPAHGTSKRHVAQIAGGK